MAVDYVIVRQQGTYNPKNNGPQNNSIPVLAAEINMYSHDGDIFIRNLYDENFNGNVEIFNLTGQKVGTYHVGGVGDFRLATSLKPGLYIVRLST